MELPFDVNKVLPKTINKITHTLIPENFKGNRNEFLECQKQITKVIDGIGEASARAQSLNKPITSAAKLRDTDHIIYILLDREANNGMGSVVGFLKTGSKHLFMFDEMGNHYELQPKCILDFYVHESRQRMGLGNTLYQHMLLQENMDPIKFAIDRPSDKFLMFLKKYYNLSKIIPQNNKFVVFEGFFNDENRDTRNHRPSSSARKNQEQVTQQPNHSKIVHNQFGTENNLFGAGEPCNQWEASKYGRYAAAKRPCSMANIIHNTALVNQTTDNNGDEPHSTSLVGVFSPMKMERPRSLSLYSNEEQKERSNELSELLTPMTLENRLQSTTSEYPPKADITAKISSSTISLDNENSDEEKSINPSPSCGQEVTTQNNQHAHLDLKFYHSPLW